MSFNGTKMIVDLPAGGAYVPIAATGPVRYVRVMESLLTAEGVANAPQGIDYRLKNDGSQAGFVTAFGLAVPPAVLELGDPEARASHHGSVIGNGPNDGGPGLGPVAATVLLMARSASVMGTSVEVTQFY